MSAIYTILQMLSAGVKAVAVGLTAYAALIWLVQLLGRNGTINPTGDLARTVRKLGDPLTRRVERWLLRQGGVPSAAPGWGVVLVIGGSLMAIWAVDFVTSAIFSMLSVGSMGPRGLLFLVADALFQILFLALMIRVIGSWVGLSPYSKLGRVVGALTDWLLDPLRRIIPPFGGTIDLTPMIAYFLLQVARSALLRALM